MITTNSFHSCHTMWQTSVTSMQRYLENASRESLWSRQKNPISTDRADFCTRLTQIPQDQSLDLCISQFMADCSFITLVFLKGCHDLMSHCQVLYRAVPNLWNYSAKPSKCRGKFSFEIKIAEEGIQYVRKNIYIYKYYILSILHFIYF